VLFFSLLLLLLCTGCSRGVFPAPNEGILELVPLAVPESYIIGQVKQRSSGALATQAADDGLDWNSARLKLKMQNSVYANGQVAVHPKESRIAILYPFTWCKVAASNHVCTQRDKVILGSNIMVSSVRKVGLFV
jgi:hypothetical protein